MGQDRDKRSKASCGHDHHRADYPFPLAFRQAEEMARSTPRYPISKGAHRVGSFSGRQDCRQWGRTRRPHELQSSERDFLGNGNGHAHCDAARARPARCWYGFGDQLAARQGRRRRHVSGLARRGCDCDFGSAAPALACPSVGRKADRTEHVVDLLDCSADVVDCIGFRRHFV